MPTDQVRAHGALCWPRMGITSSRGRFEKNMKNEMGKLPPPGLDGTHRDGCVACATGTDTVLGITGPAEAAIAALVYLGIDSDAAMIMLNLAHGRPPVPNMVPEGRGPWIMRLCEACAGRGEGRPLPVSPVHGPIQTISFPDDGGDA